MLHMMTVYTVVSAVFVISVLFTDSISSSGTHDNVTSHGVYSSSSQQPGHCYVYTYSSVTSHHMHLQLDYLGTGGCLDPPAVPTH